MVRDRLVPEHLPEDARRHVGRAGRGECDEGEGERAGEAEGEDRGSVGGGAHRDRPAVPPHAPHPAAHQREQRPADGLGRVEQAEHLRAAVVLGHRREERDGHAEQHRVDVHRIAPQQLLPRARVPPSLAHPRDARGRGLGRRRDRAHAGEEGQRDEERRGVDRVRGAEPERRDQHAGEGRAGDLRRVAAEAVERRGGGQLVARHEPRQHRVERRALEPARARHPRRDDEQHPDVRLVEQRVGEEDQREDEQRRVGDEDQPAAVVGVGQRPAEQRREQQRHDLREADQAHQQRRARQVVDLERDRDVREHRARVRDRLADVEQPELAMPPEGTGVDGEAPEQATQGGHAAASLGARADRRHLAPGRADPARGAAAPAAEG